MTEITPDITAQQQVTQTHEAEGLLHGPFVNPRGMTYPALELQLFALEMGCVDNNGFHGDKLKSAIKKFVVSREVKREKPSPQISADEVSKYIEQTSVNAIASRAFEIIATIPNLQSTEHLAPYSKGEHISVKDEGYSCHYAPFSPIAFSIDSFQQAAQHFDIEPPQTSD